MTAFTNDDSALIQKEYAHLDTTYFNAAYFGPSPYSAKQKVSNAMFKELDPSFATYNSWMGIPERIREQLAELVGCSIENITLQSSSTDIMNLVANGIKLKEGEAIAGFVGEYPSDVLPFMRAQELGKLKFDMLKSEIPNSDDLKKQLSPKTRAVVLSHVAFDTGRRVDLLDLGKYCQKNGILFMVDVTQSLGGMGISKEELALIDVLTCSSYKWILGPYGHAFAYFSDKALEMIEYTNPSWTKQVNIKDPGNLLDYTTETLPGARKFDRGQSPTMLINACLEAGVNLLNTIGLEKIGKNNAELRDYFLDNFPKNKYQVATPLDHCGNIVCLRAKELDSSELERELQQRNVDVSVRQGKLRLSFHLYNTKDQVNAMIRALDI